MTATLIDLTDRLIDTLETDATVTKDRSGRVPDTFEPNTLYVFPDGSSDTRIFNMETGPPSVEEFHLLAVFMADAGMEEARQERSTTVSEGLSSKRDLYMQRLSAVKSCDLWDQIEADVDSDWQTNFEGRAVALRINGYRFL